MKFEVACPNSIQEALECASHAEGQVAYICGGTDLMLRLFRGEVKADLLIDISQITEMSYIKLVEDRIKIGSATPFTRLAEDYSLLQNANCLVQAASQIGSLQIRNRGTLGGNIASASPAGDALPPLLVLDAWLTLVGSEGQRRISFASLQAGQDELRPGELIKEIDFPAWGKEYDSGFHKLGSRSAVSIAKLNMAWLLKINRENNQIQEARLAVGALAKTPQRLPGIEQSLTGALINPALVEKTAQMLTESVDQLIPSRPSREYKRIAIKGFAHEMFKGFLSQGG